MKTRKAQLFMAVPVLLIAFLAFNSFKPFGNSFANGGGIASGTHFNLNAVKQSSGNVVGHIQWGGVDYNVICATWSGKTAILYAGLDNTATIAFELLDNGQGSNDPADMIRYTTDVTGCSIDFDAVYTSTEVTSGNIMVKE
jgi:hypothetical protein